MIEVKGLRKSYENFMALNNVDIRVNKGSIYGLLGSNGAGKSTLLKTLAGIYKQDTGEVLINNEKVYDNENAKSKFFFIPDELYFFPGCTITDMALFYKRIYPNWNEERFNKLRQAFQIDLKKKVHRLSKGMQKQVAFWLALSAMPELLILDEPFDGLDAVMRQQVRSLIIQDAAERQLTVIVTSHNLRELEDFCDHICVLHKGSVILEKDIDNLKSDIHKVQAGFKDSKPGIFLEDIHILHQEQSGGLLTLIAKGNREALKEKLTKYNPVLLDILPLSLEEIFIYEMEDLGYEFKNFIL